MASNALDECRLLSDFSRATPSERSAFITRFHSLNPIAGAALLAAELRLHPPPSELDLLAPPLQHGSIIPGHELDVRRLAEQVKEIEDAARENPLQLDRAQLLLASNPLSATGTAAKKNEGKAAAASSAAYAKHLRSQSRHAVSYAVDCDIVRGSDRQFQTQLYSLLWGECNESDSEGVHSKVSSSKQSQDLFADLNVADVLLYGRTGNVAANSSQASANMAQNLRNKNNSNNATNKEGAAGGSRPPSGRKQSPSRSSADSELVPLHPVCWYYMQKTALTNEKKLCRKVEFDLRHVVPEFENRENEAPILSTLGLGAGGVSSSVSSSSGSKSGRATSARGNGSSTGSSKGLAKSCEIICERFRIDPEEDVVSVNESSTTTNNNNSSTSNSATSSVGNRPSSSTHARPASSRPLTRSALSSSSASRSRSRSARSHSPSKHRTSFISAILSQHQHGAEAQTEQQKQDAEKTEQTQSQSEEEENNEENGTPRVKEKEKKKIKIGIQQLPPRHPRHRRSASTGSVTEDGSIVGAPSTHSGSGSSGSGSSASVIPSVSSRPSTADSAALSALPPLSSATALFLARMSAHGRTDPTQTKLDKLYFNKDDLRTFLRTPYGSGALLKFVLSRANNNELIRCTWVDKKFHLDTQERPCWSNPQPGRSVKFLVQTRCNNYNLNDAGFSFYERTLTYPHPGDHRIALHDLENEFDLSATLGHVARQAEYLRQRKEDREKEEKKKRVAAETKAKVAAAAAAAAAGVAGGNNIHIVPVIASAVSAVPVSVPSPSSSPSPSPLDDSSSLLAQKNNQHYSIRNYEPGTQLHERLRAICDKLAVYFDLVLASGYNKGENNNNQGGNYSNNYNSNGNHSTIPLPGVRRRTKKMQLYFRRDACNQLWLLWSDCLEFSDPSSPCPQRAAAQAEAIEAARLHAKAQSNKRASVFAMQREAAITSPDRSNKMRRIAAMKITEEKEEQLGSGTNSPATTHKRLSTSNNANTNGHRKTSQMDSEVDIDFDELRDKYSADFFDEEDSSRSNSSASAVVVPTTGNSANKQQQHTTHNNATMAAEKNGEDDSSSSSSSSSSSDDDSSPTSPSGSDGRHSWRAPRVRSPLKSSARKSKHHSHHSHSHPPQQLSGQAPFAPILPGMKKENKRGRNRHATTNSGGEYAINSGMDSPSSSSSSSRELDSASSSSIPRCCAHCRLDTDRRDLYFLQLHSVLHTYTLEASANGYFHQHKLGWQSGAAALEWQDAPLSVAEVKEVARRESVVNKHARQNSLGSSSTTLAGGPPSLERKPSTLNGTDRGNGTDRSGGGGGHQRRPSSAAAPPSPALSAMGANNSPAMGSSNTPTMQPIQAHHAHQASFSLTAAPASASSSSSSGADPLLSVAGSKRPSGLCAGSSSSHQLALLPDLSGSASEGAAHGTKTMHSAAEDPTKNGVPSFALFLDPELSLAQFEARCKDPTYLARSLPLCGKCVGHVWMDPLLVRAQCGQPLNPIQHTLATSRSIGAADGTGSSSNSNDTFAWLKTKHMSAYDRAHARALSPGGGSESAATNAGATAPAATPSDFLARNVAAAKDGVWFVAASTRALQRELSTGSGKDPLLCPRALTNRWAHYDEGKEDRDLATSLQVRLNASGSPSAKQSDSAQKQGASGKKTAEAIDRRYGLRSDRNFNTTRSGKQGSARTLSSSQSLSSLSPSRQLHFPSARSSPSSVALAPSSSPLSASLSSAYKAQDFSNQQKRDRDMQFGEGDLSEEQEQHIIVEQQGETNNGEQQQKQAQKNTTSPSQSPPLHLSSSRPSVSSSSSRTSLSPSPSAPPAAVFGSRMEERIAASHLAQMEREQRRLAKEEEYEAEKRKREAQAEEEEKKRRKGMKSSASSPSLLSSAPYLSEHLPAPTNILIYERPLYSPLRRAPNAPAQGSSLLSSSLREATWERVRALQQSRRALQSQAEMHKYHIRLPQERENGGSLIGATQQQEETDKDAQEEEKEEARRRERAEEYRRIRRSQSIQHSRLIQQQQQQQEQQQQEEQAIDESGLSESFESPSPEHVKKHTLSHHAATTTSPSAAARTSSLAALYSPSSSSSAPHSHPHARSHIAPLNFSSLTPSDKTPSQGAQEVKKNQAKRLTPVKSKLNAPEAAAHAKFLASPLSVAAAAAANRAALAPIAATASPTSLPVSSSSPPAASSSSSSTLPAPKVKLLSPHSAAKLHVMESMYRVQGAAATYSFHRSPSTRAKKNKNKGNNTNQPAQANTADNTAEHTENEEAQQQQQQPVASHSSERDYEA